MVDPDRGLKGFFSQWYKGIKVYSSSPVNLLFVKLWFLGLVVIGLFTGSVQRFIAGDFLLSFLFFCFGAISAVDFRLLLLNFVKIKKFDRLGGSLNV